MPGPDFGCRVDCEVLPFISSDGVDLLLLQLLICGKLEEGNYGPILFAIAFLWLGMFEFPARLKLERNYEFELWLITRAWKAMSLKSGSFFSWGQNMQALIGRGTISVTSRRKLAPRRRGRVVRVLDSRPESPEFGSHSQQFEIQGHAL